MKNFYNYILIVDDQEGIRKLLNEVLTLDNYEIEQAASGLEAIEKIRTKTPSLILLDLKMPGMDGMETFKHIQRLAPNVPVIIMSAYYETNTLTENLLSHNQINNRFLPKPFDIGEIRRIINDTINKTNTINRKNLSA